MVLITGVIKNTDGSPYVGSVKFALNNLGIELNTVYLPTVVTVDSDGTFTVDLWPNTNSLTSTYYKCSLDNGSVFNVSIPGNNPSYNLGDVILIDPGTLDSGILRRLNQIESGITTRIGDLEYYTGIADNRIPSIALSGDYPNAVAGKVSKILTMGDGLTGGTYRGDTDVTVAVDGTVIRDIDDRLSDAREWVAPTAPIEVVSQPTNTTRYAWTPQRIWDTIVSWFSTITSDDIPEGGGNLYYTDSRVSNNLDVQTNTTKVSATGSVTTHNDITSPGSGQIITTSERTKLGNIEDNAQVNTVNSVAGKTGDVVLDSNDVGLGNVPNIDTSNASNITSGTLSGSRLSYGTEANTPAQGNDARFTDSREWTASTVSQPVAQAGTDTTRHAWTSQRVRDNVASYTLPYTSAEKSKLAGLQNALDDKQDKPAEGAFVDGDKTKLDTASSHASATSNPHGTTAAQVGAVPITGGGFQNQVSISKDTAIGNNSSQLNVIANSGGNNRTSGISFFGTFGGSILDTGSRKTADLISGFQGGVWGTEYLSLRVGRNGSSNDNQSLTDEVIRLRSNGRVGIGTPSPTEKLEVSGNIKSSGIIDAAGGTFTGDVTTTGKLTAERFSSVEVSLGNAITEITPPSNGGIIAVMYTGSDTDFFPQSQCSGILAYDVGQSPRLQSLALAPNLISVGTGDLNSVTAGNSIVIGVASGKIRLRSTWSGTKITQVTFIV